MSNNVKSFRLKDGEEENTVCRFVANSTHLSFHSDRGLILSGAAYVFFCSDD